MKTYRTRAYNHHSFVALWRIGFIISINILTSSYVNPKRKHPEATRPRILYPIPNEPVTRNSIKCRIHTYVPTYELNVCTLYIGWRVWILSNFQVLEYLSIINILYLRVSISHESKRKEADQVGFVWYIYCIDLDTRGLYLAYRARMDLSNKGCLVRKFKSELKMFHNSYFEWHVLAVALYLIFQKSNLYFSRYIRLCF